MFIKYGAGFRAGEVTSEIIRDGAILNVDVNEVAAIAGSKLDPAIPNTVATLLTDHDKALHDALGIDAHSVDGEHASELLRLDGIRAMTGNLDMNNFALLNAKLGTALNVDGYKIFGASGSDKLMFIGAGSSARNDTGAGIEMSGINSAINPGFMIIDAGKKSGASVALRTYDAALTGIKERIAIRQGDTPDIELKNCILNFSTGYPALETGKTATGEFLKIEVEGVTKFLALYA